MRASGSPTGRTGLRALALLVAVALPAAACNRAGEERPHALGVSRAVSFESADGVHLEGRLFGDGRVGVVLSHMLPADQSSWYRFADDLASQGYLVLTYDFRGYCPGGNAGCSEGERDIASIWQDVIGAAGFVASKGASAIVLIGASMGGTASLVAAPKLDLPPAAIITLSAPTSIEGLVADATVLQQLVSAKLFVAGEFDAAAAASADELDRYSPPPKRVLILPTGDHGTDLLTGSQGEVVRTTILTYLDQYAAA